MKCHLEMQFEIKLRANIRQLLPFGVQIKSFQQKSAPSVGALLFLLILCVVI